MGNANLFDSPDEVVLKGEVRGVTRLSRWARFAFIGGFAGLLAFVLFLVFTMDDTAPNAASKLKKDQQQAAADNKNLLEPANADALTKGVGQGVAVVDPVTPLGPGFALKAPVAAVPAAPGAPVASPSPRNLQLPAATVPAPGGDNLTVPAPTPAQLAAQQRRDQLAQALERARTSAIDAGGAAAAPARPAAPAAALPNSALFGGGAPAEAGNPLLRPADDPNKQLRKEAFLADAATKPLPTVLAESRRAAPSPYMVQAGWAIPGVLGCGLNSDLPGQTCGLVRENVYDSATGRYLLIPQGTKIIGTYDAQLAMGQARLLVVWNRLIFPDGSSLTLQGMPGADAAGHAGFGGTIDNHYLRIYGNAMMLSLFSAGMQLSQPQQSATGAAPSAGQTLAAGMAQQLGQVGSNMISRNMNIQPTLLQQIGYRFNIMVTRDILFPGPYRR